MPITGLDFFRIPNTEKYSIFVATPTRLYYFNGRTNPDEKPLLQQVFNKYLNIPEKDTYTEVQSNFRYSRLRFWAENLIYPRSFGWLTKQSIIYGEVIIFLSLYKSYTYSICLQIDSARQEDIEAIIDNCQTIKYPKPLYEDYSVSQKPPFACVITEFHILLAYTDKIKGVSILNKEVVYEDNYNEAFGRLINIVKDPQTSILFSKI